MPPSKQIKVYGNTYKLKSSSTAVPLDEVASYVDSIMRELSGLKGKASSIDLTVLTALNIAQEFLEIQHQTEEAEKQDEAAYKVLKLKGLKLGDNPCEGNLFMLG